MTGNKIANHTEHMLELAAAVIDDNPELAAFYFKAFLFGINYLETHFPDGILIQPTVDKDLT